MNIAALKGSMIFRGMTSQEIADAAEHLAATEKSYQKGAVILHAGDTTDKMGLVLDGSVTIENNDIWGNRTILSHVGCGGFFAETYGLLRTEILLVDVVANEDCKILFLTIGNLRQPGFESASWTSRVTTNLLTISARKNLLLSGRSFHTSPKTIRGRVLSYLNTVSIQSGKSDFDIPFDRQQMADYLCLDRTALSKELGRMREEGLIDFRKNHFTLLLL